MIEARAFGRSLVARRRRARVHGHQASRVQAAKGARWAWSQRAAASRTSKRPSWSPCEVAIEHRDWQTARRLARTAVSEWRAVRGFVEAGSGDAGRFDEVLVELLAAVEASPVEIERVERAMAPQRTLFEVG